jgi:hypothetical protein
VLSTSITLLFLGHTSQGQVKFTHTPLGKYFGCGRGRGWLLGLMVLETSSVATGTPSLEFGESAWII